MLKRKKRSDSDRFVLVHFHVFKNGGTSFDYALKREFGRNFAEFDGNRPMHAHRPEDIADFLRDHPRVLALSSHHLRFPLPKIPDHQLLSAFFLRHPLDRMHSIYRYERKQRSSSPGSQHAKKLDFPDYVRWRLDQGRTNLLCNFHASILTCNPRLGLRKPDAELARQRLLAVDVLGTVERMEDSLALGECRLRQVFENVDLATTPQNVTSGRKQTLEGRLEEAEKACGSELFADVASRNLLDLELHAMAGECLQKRIDALDDGVANLKDFRLRCQQLA